MAIETEVQAFEGAVTKSGPGISAIKSLWCKFLDSFDRNCKLVNQNVYFNLTHDTKQKVNSQNQSTYFWIIIFDYFQIKITRQSFVDNYL